MKNTIKQLFHSGKFVVGFSIFALIIAIVIVYPLIVTNDPLEMVGRGNFFKPGTYIASSDVAQMKDTYSLNIDTAQARLESTLTVQNRALMADWLTTYGGLASAEVDVSDAESLVDLWQKHYDPADPQKGLTAAAKNKFKRLDKEIDGLLEDTNLIVSRENADGKTSIVNEIDGKEFINTKDVVNQVTFILGTDNFGRDVLTELVSAAKTSLKMGLLAGAIATIIGLTLGLIAGYVGGVVDDMIIFVTNLLTVIPSFVILILVSYSISSSQRGTMLVAALIGCTSWPWTTRSVRAQVISLRNRDHVNLSKLSGHGFIRIILTDVLPYLASYVVLAFIQQISNAILSEAQLSMLGLGPSTTKEATLGLMMNWATQYAAHINGSWWAYIPVIMVIALIAFSLNLMNAGMDQVFNPQLRD